MFFWPHFVYGNKQTKKLCMCFAFIHQFQSTPFLLPSPVPHFACLHTDLSFPPSKASLTSTLTPHRVCGLNLQCLSHKDWAFTQQYTSAEMSQLSAWVFYMLNLTVVSKIRAVSSWAVKWHGNINHWWDSSQWCHTFQMYWLKCGKWGKKKRWLYFLRFSLWWLELIFYLKLSLEHQTMYMNTTKWWVILSFLFYNSLLSKAYNLTMLFSAISIWAW